MLLETILHKIQKLKQPVAQTIYKFGLVRIILKVWQPVSDRKNFQKDSEITTKSYL